MAFPTKPAVNFIIGVTCLFLKTYQVFADYSR